MAMGHMINKYNQDYFEGCPEEFDLYAGAGRVAIGCVADNNPKFLAQALRLLQSVRWFGGSMCGTNFFVCVVDECPAEYVHEFESLGAFIRTVPRLDSPTGPSNKLRFFEIPELVAYDTVILLDCDTLVVQDPWPHLDGARFQSKITDLPTMPHKDFEQVFRSLDLQLPGRHYRCNPHGTPTIWYCNTGVTVFPSQFLGKLSRRWMHYNQLLLNHLELLRPETYHFLDQTALTLAFVTDPVPYRELPLKMNFPAHLEKNRSMRDCDPVIIHYHWCVDEDGYLQASPFPQVQNRIEQFNKRLLDHRQQHEHRQPGRLPEPRLADRPQREDPATTLRRPVFLVGSMRSGTTLLAKLLSHYDGIVHCPFELKDIWSEVGGVPMASPKTRDTCCPEFGADDVQTGQANRLARAFFAEMKKHGAGKNKDAVLLNKNPHLCNKLPFVDALFPDARFIWIHRALPRIVASLKQLFEDVCQRQQTWHFWPVPRTGTSTRCWEAFHFQRPPDDVDPARCFPGGKLHYLAEYWLESNGAVARFLQHLPARRALVIREENLIERPRIEIARCLAFLGLPLEDLSPLEDEVSRSRNDLWTSRLTPEEHVELLEYLESHAHDVEQVFPKAEQSTRLMILDSLRRRVCEELTFTGDLETNTPPLADVKKRA